MRKYKNYIKSEDVWIGEIPSHWSVRRIKTLGAFSKGKGIKKDETVSSGLACIRYGEIYTEYDKVVYNPISFITNETAVNSQLIKNGDILFAGSGETIEDIGKSVVYCGTQEAFAGGDIIILRPGPELNPFLASYLFNASFVQHQKSVSAKGEIIVHIYPKDIGEIRIPLPPVKEQELIFDYLDLKCKKIDLLISSKLKLIQLLQEERSGIINHAVTKGINPKVKMKFCGIDWIGEIPEHWEVKKLKYLLKGSLQYGANESAESNDKSQPRYIRITDFNESGDLREDTFRSLPFDVAKEYLLENGDVLFARSGATVGKTFLFESNFGIACFAGYLIRARVDELNLTSKYLYLYTRSGAYEQWKNSIFNQATIQNIGADKYSLLQITVPPQDEQILIVKHIEAETTKIDIAINLLYNELKLLNEYKISFINEVVTGKFCVLQNENDINWYELEKV